MQKLATDPADHRLQEILRSARPSPPLPPGFPEQVWKRIQRADIAAAQPGLLEVLNRWVEPWLRPRLALGGLLALLAISAAAGLLSAPGLARHEAQLRYLASVSPHASP